MAKLAEKLNQISTDKYLFICQKFDELLKSIKKDVTTRLKSESFETNLKNAIELSDNAILSRAYGYNTKDNGPLFNIYIKRVDENIFGKKPYILTVWNETFMYDSPLIDKRERDIVDEVADLCETILKSDYGFKITKRYNTIGGINLELNW